MINVRPEIYSSIKDLCDNVSYGYPDNFTTFPVITYLEENNSTVKKSKNYECSLIRIKFDIYNKDKSCQEYADKIDEIMSNFGFTLSYSSDVNELSNIKHKVMTYTAKVDSNGYVYSV